MKKLLAFIVVVSVVAVPLQASAHNGYPHKKIVKWYHHGSGGYVHPMKVKMQARIERKLKSGVGNCYTDSARNGEMLDVPFYHGYTALFTMKINWCFKNGAITYAEFTDDHWEKWFGHFDFDGWTDVAGGEHGTSKNPKRYRYHRAYAIFNQAVCYVGVCYHFTQKPGIAITVQADKTPTIQLYWK